MRELNIVTVALLMLSISLTAQNTQSNVWINERGNVEMSPETAIDRSKIVSDWLRMRDTIASYERKLKKADSIIVVYQDRTNSFLREIKATNDYIVSLNEKIDKIQSIPEKEKRNYLSGFSLYQQAGYDFIGKDLFTLTTRLKYDIKKIYIFTEGIANSRKEMHLSTGIGVTIF